MSYKDSKYNELKHGACGRAITELCQMKGPARLRSRLLHPRSVVALKQEPLERGEEASSTVRLRPSAFVVVGTVVLVLIALPPVLWQSPTVVSGRMVQEVPTEKQSLVRDNGELEGGGGAPWSDQELLSFVELWEMDEGRDLDLFDEDLLALEEVPL